MSAVASGQREPSRDSSDQLKGANVLFLLFHLGEERYALDTGQIAEVLPLVGIRQIPHAPHAVAGVLNHRGAPVPVIDLCQLTMGRPAQRRLDTRIVVVHHCGDNGTTRLLGLIAERATETLRLDAAGFNPSGITNAATPFLGPVTTHARGLVQRIEVNQLLPPSLRDLLFRQPLEP